MRMPKSLARRRLSETCFEMAWARRDGLLYVEDLGLVEAIPISAVAGTRLACQRARRGLGARWREWWLAARLQLHLRRGKDIPWPTLCRLEDKYYVDSGHAAVAAAKSLGKPSLRARVLAYQAPSTDLQGLVVRERAEFERRTGLSGIELRLPGRYPQLARHIEQHHRYLEAARGHLFRFDEAVADWWQRIYAPVVRGMAGDGVTARVPGFGAGEGFCLLAEYLERTATGPELPLSQAFLELVDSDLDWQSKAQAFTPPCLFGDGCPYG